MKTIKLLSFFACLLVIALVAFADRLAQDKDKKVVDLKRENVVLKNDSFLLTREQEPEYNDYRIYFNEISARDTIVSLKRIIEYCEHSENGNPYSIYFEMDDTEKFNRAFLESVNKRKRLSQEEMYDKLKMACRYKGFLRKHLCLIGCVLNDSVLFSMTDAACCVNENKEPFLIGEVCIYFNWHKISNSAESGEAMQSRQRSQSIEKGEPHSTAFNREPQGWPEEL